MKNLLLTLLLFVVNLSYSQSVITDTLNCQGDTTTLTYIVPSAGLGGIFLNCDIITGTHLFSVNVPSNPNDNIQTLWLVYAIYNGSPIIDTFDYSFAPYTFTESGCYRFDLVFMCTDLSQTSGTMALSSTYYISTVGIEELTLDRKVIKITNIIGEECLPESNKILIYHYNDGTTEKVYINK